MRRASGRQCAHDVEQLAVRRGGRNAGDVRQVIGVAAAGPGGDRVGDEGKDDRNFARAPQRRLERRRRECDQQIGAVAERGVDERTQRRHVALRVAHA